MFCNKCGSPMADQASFCPICGAPAVEVPTSSTPAGGAQPANNGAKTAQAQFTVSASVTPPHATGQQSQASAGSASASATVQQPVPSNPTPNAGDPQNFAFQPVDTSRSIFTYILLSIFTCSIYSWWFLHQMVTDVNRMCEGDGDRTPGVLQLFLLSCITCGIYGLYWYYKLGNRLALNANRYGFTFNENGTTVLLWMTLGTCIVVGPWIGMNILIKNSNALGMAYNARLTSRFN